MAGIVVGTMTAKTLALTILLLAPLSLFGAENAPLRWITLPGPPVQVNGLPWYSENGGDLFRLPAQLKDTFRPPVWDLAKDPSGGRIRFRTNSSILAIRLEYPKPPDMANMHAFGETGVDLYADGVYRGTAIATRDAQPGKTLEHTFFQDQPRLDREITLYLPLYMPVKVLGIGLDPDAQVRPAKPFAAATPLVFYGTSITQGGCASRPGMSYQAILGRMLNLDFVNLGFSGNGRGEPELSHAVANINVAASQWSRPKPPPKTFSRSSPTASSSPTPGDPVAGRLRLRHSQHDGPCTRLRGILPSARLAGLALGGRTYKLKFGHHGLGNHPVRNNTTGKVEITAHNHNFAVDPDSIMEIGKGGTRPNILHQDYP